MKISDLKPLEKNPFKAKDDKQIEKIGKSINDFERMMSINQENRDFFCIFTYCFIGHLTLSDNKEIKKASFMKYVVRCVWINRGCFKKK